MLNRTFINKYYAIPDWHVHAACIGLDIGIFFPDYGGGEKAFAQAKKVCESCPVIAECLDRQLELESFEDQWGMFGGMTPRERKKIRNRRDRGL